MLTTLHVKNFTIVDELFIEFGPGMICFTGETGAGKSITLDALSLALGARADHGIARPGTTQCDITAVFTVKNNPLVQAWLSEQSLILTEEAELTLRRVVTTKGRSKCYVEGVPFPLNKVKELGPLLVNIHGQNQQYHLLKSDIHREQLDAFALHDDKLKEMAKIYAEIQSIEQQIKTIVSQKQDENALALLRYQVLELEELAVGVNEFEALTKEQQLLSHQKDLANKIDHWQTLIKEDDNSVLALLYRIKQDMSELSHQNMSQLLEYIDNAIIQCEEGLAEIQHSSRDFEENPERLQQVEKRLEILFDVSRKHHIRPQDLFVHFETLQKQLNNFEQSNKAVCLLKETLAKKEEEAKHVAMELHHIRLKVAIELSKKITQAIQSLGMPDGEVDVQVSLKEQLSQSGLDKVEYWVRLNKGMDKQPLSKIASGGELSRISLAIQVLTAEKKEYPTLVFDEVDTGIGGVQAANVGKLLRRLGDHTQVFCITHQAQVAAYANTHFLVKKESLNNQTVSSFIKLTEIDKISELARMLSGETMTKETKQHAKKLLEQAEQ